MITLTWWQLFIVAAISNLAASIILEIFRRGGKP